MQSVLSQDISFSNNMCMKTNCDITELGKISGKTLNYFLETIFGNKLSYHPELLASALANAGLTSTIGMNLSPKLCLQTPLLKSSSSPALFMRLSSSRGLTGLPRRLPTLAATASRVDHELDVLVSDSARPRSDSIDS